LGACQHCRQLFAGPDHRHRAGPTLLGQRFQAVPACRDQREFRGDEEGVERDQQDRQQDRPH
jgi:hypothetical protein